MKKLLLMALASLGFFGVSVGIREVGLKNVIFKKKRAYTDSRIGFELINKANRPIWFTVSNGDDLLLGKDNKAFYLEAATKERPAVGPAQLDALDISKPTQLAVWLKDPGEVTIEAEAQPKIAPLVQAGIKAGIKTGFFKKLLKKKTEQKPAEIIPVGPKKFTPAPDKLYSFTPGKTIYLTWDKKDFAHPETGPLRGVLGKTDSNLSLKINVKKGDIKDITDKARS